MRTDAPYADRRTEDKFILPLYIYIYIYIYIYNKQNTKRSQQDGNFKFCNTGRNLNPD
jgi:hypothetical protein